MLGRRWQVLSALVLGLAALSGALAPQGLAPLDGRGGTALALDRTVETCEWAAFKEALDAIQADGGGTLTLDCDGVIDYAAEQTIATDVKLVGVGEVTFDGNESTRFFNVAATGSLELVNLTLWRGSVPADQGGGAIAADGDLTITASRFIDNQAHDGGAIAITGSSVLTVSDSTFSGNRATNTGGAIAYQSGASWSISRSTFNDNEADTGGAIYAAQASELTISASTFTENRTDFGGGGIAIGSGAVEIVGSTLVDNQAGTQGGAIWVGSTATLTITASIVAGNSAEQDGDNCFILPFATYASGGYNLSDDDSCGFVEEGDIQNSAHIDLGPLTDNGGPTLTRMPQLTSDAVDKVPCNLTTPQDQRGFTRPTDGLDCEIGAVEVGMLSQAVTLCANRFTGLLAATLAGGGCPSGSVALSLPGEQPTTICIHASSGQLSWAARGTCSSAQYAHSVPGDGPLAYCEHAYTGKLRYSRTGTCSPVERPGVIPG